MLTHLISFPDLNDGGVPREYCLASQGIFRKPRSGGGVREYWLASQGILRKPRSEGAFGDIVWLPKEYYGNFGWPKRNSSVFQNQVLTEHQDTFVGLELLAGHHRYQVGVHYNPVHAPVVVKVATGVLHPR